MTTEQMAEALQRKGYATTTYKPGFFYREVLAVETPDYNAVINDVMEVFHRCPEHEWVVKHGKTILWFPELTV
jgi:hypothetical protein